LHAAFPDDHLFEFIVDTAFDAPPFGITHVDRFLTPNVWRPSVARLPPQTNDTDFLVGARDADD
jgi:hypothetical protein